MGHQIIKQPDGLYAVWSTIIDDFILRDANTETLIEFMTREAITKLVDDVWRVIHALEKGGKPYYQFTKTWETACQRRADVHGKSEEDS